MRVGTLGRLNPVKAYDILCEAVALLKDHPDLPPFRLQIAGDGPEHAALQDRITAGNLPIDLLGYESKPFDFLKTLHLYVQSSHWEGMCVAGHEAMSCGLPVVSTLRANWRRAFSTVGRDASCRSTMPLPLRQLWRT